MRTAVLLSCLLCSGLASIGGAARVSYQVVPGDTAFSVAKRFGVTVEVLLAENNLAAPDLKVGQTLVFEAPGASASLVAPLSPAVPEPAPASPAGASTEQAPEKPAKSLASRLASNAERFTVGAGDTLYSIARRVGATVDSLISLNKLDSPSLKVGQVLNLRFGPTARAAEAATHDAPVAAPSDAVLSTSPMRGLRDLALRFLNVPYVFGGATASGTDCSGLVIQVFGALGLKLPRQSAVQATVGESVNRAELREGDLVFFDTEGRGQVTHVGIVLGHDEFVHANSYDGRVTVSRLSEKYYATRYLGARRVLTLFASQK